MIDPVVTAMADNSNWLGVWLGPSGGLGRQFAQKISDTLMVSL